MRIASLGCGLFLSACLLPSTADAQPEAFQQVVRELAALSSAAGQPGGDVVRAVAGRLRGTLTEWDRALRTTPASRVETGLAYRRRGRLLDALREFDAAALEQPGRADVQVLRALTLEAAGRLPESAQAFVDAWSLDAANPVTVYYVAQRATNAGTAERTRARTRLLAFYTTIDAAPPRAAPFMVLEAVPDTLSQLPVLGDALTSEAFALLRAGRLDDAVTALERAATTPLPTAAASPRAHFARGQRYEAENRVADARREYEATLAGVLAGRSAIFIGLGRLAQVDGDPAAAVAALEQAVRLTPNDPLAHRELADAYASQSRRDEAMAELMAALLIDPRDALAHAAVGSLYLDAGRPADAVTALTRALALRPARYQTRYTLARALDQVGRGEDAARERALFEKARLESLARRKRIMASEREQEDAVRRRQGPEGDAK
jgi:tetratricopeptide (TPR) repeat protein